MLAAGCACRGSRRLLPTTRPRAEPGQNSVLENRARRRGRSRKTQGALKSVLRPADIFAATRRLFRPKKRREKTAILSRESHRNDRRKRVQPGEAALAPSTHVPGEQSSTRIH